MHARLFKLADVCVYEKLKFHIPKVFARKGRARFLLYPSCQAQTIFISAVYELERSLSLQYMN